MCTSSLSKKLIGSGSLGKGVTSVGVGGLTFVDNWWTFSANCSCCCCVVLTREEIVLLTSRMWVSSRLVKLVNCLSVTLLLGWLVNSL